MNIQSFKKYRWYILAAALLPLTVFELVTLYRMPSDSVTAQQAKKMGLDPVKYSDLMPLMDRTNTPTVSNADWSELVGLYYDKQWFFRSSALSTMGLIKDPSKRQQIVEFAQASLNDPEPHCRTEALTILRRFKYPSWKEVARRQLQDPSSYVAGYADRMLSLGERP